MIPLPVEGPPGEDITRVLQTRKKSWMQSRRFEEELEGDKIHADILNEVINEVHENDHHKNRFQEFLDKILQYTPLQIVLLVLAIIDVAVVVTEILVTLHVYDIEKKDLNDALGLLLDFLTDALHMKRQSYLDDIVEQLNKTLQSIGISNCSSSSPSNARPEPVISAPDHVIDNLSPINYLASYGSGIKPGRLLRIKKDVNYDVIPYNGLPLNGLIEQLHSVEAALNITSIVILGIFVVVVFLKIAAEGRHFFTQVMEIIDSIVVILSFILDIVKFTGIMNKDATEAVIVLLLLWQIVRMFNGIMLSELKRLEFRIKLLKRTRKKLEVKLHTHISKSRQLEKEIECLKKLSRQRGALEDEINTCKPELTKTKPSAMAGLSSIASMSLGLSISTPLALDLQEHRKNLLKSISKGAPATNEADENAGFSLVALFPKEELFVTRTSEACLIGNIETMESIVEEDESKRNRRVTFYTEEDENTDDEARREVESDLISNGNDDIEVFDNNDDKTETLSDDNSSANSKDSDSNSPDIDCSHL